MAPLSLLLGFALSCLLLDAAHGLQTQLDNRGCAGAPTVSFAEFVRRYERPYAIGSEEYARRQGIFAGHARAIAKHTCEKGADHPWRVAVNHLADRTEGELRGLRGYRKNAHPQAPGSSSSSAWLAAERNGGFRAAAPIKKLPGQISYRNLTTITTNRDQKDCGSCWAHAAINAIDAQHELLTGQYKQFSVTQLIACTPNPQHCGGSGACDGATSELAFEYATKHRLHFEETLPENPGGAAGTCPLDMQAAANVKATPASIGRGGHEVHEDKRQPLALSQSDGIDAQGDSVRLHGWVRFPMNSQRALMQGLVDLGPLAVAVTATYMWSFYSGGIMMEDGCDPDLVVNHAVVLYGYGESEGTKIWEIKNSWGRQWGEEGKIRMERHDDEDKRCGWDNHPEQGSGCDGGPSKVWVCGTCGILYDMSAPMFQKSARF